MSSENDINFFKTIGGTDSDKGRSIHQTIDGGYIIVGGTRSYGNGNLDVWLIKVNKLGDTQWSKTFGGNKFDEGHSVKQTSDEGYIIVGNTESFGNGGDDVWLIKTDKYGSIEWNKTFGGNEGDGGYSVELTSDGGYIIIGTTYSFGVGESDIWLIKTDYQGKMEWNKTFGEENSDWGSTVKQTYSDEYIILGETYEVFNDKSIIRLIKVDKNGTMKWNATFDGKIRNME